MPQPPKKTDRGSLSAAEARDLARLECDVQSGLTEFRRAGLALAEIRERKLHREEYATFDDYCRERWGLSKTHANRLISAAQIVESLTLEAPVGAVLPQTESQCRALAGADPEDRAMAWSGAVDLAGGEQPTAEEVLRAVELAREIDPEEYAAAVAEETEAARRRGERERDERSQEKSEKKLKRADDEMRKAIRWYRAEGLTDEEIRERFERALKAGRKAG